MPIKVDKDKLDAVTAYIVHQMGEVGVFHYNKLAYLFEYLYIKNFGKRYTKEQFVRLPHGPTIRNYKNQIKRLVGNQLADTDLDNLMKKRAVDDKEFDKVTIKRPYHDIEHSLPTPIMDLIDQIIAKYGRLSTKEIEKAVYQTPPMIKYMELVNRETKEINVSAVGSLIPGSFNYPKPEVGGYVLQSDCIKMRDFDTPEAKGKRLALKHLEKYPDVNYDLQNRLAEELDYLTALRPTL